MIAHLASEEANEGLDAEILVLEGELKHPSTVIPIVVIVSTKAAVFRKADGYILILDCAKIGRGALW